MLMKKSCDHCEGTGAQPALVEASRDDPQRRRGDWRAYPHVAKSLVTICVCRPYAEWSIAVKAHRRVLGLVSPRTRYTCVGAGDWLSRVDFEKDQMPRSLQWGTAARPLAAPTSVNRSATRLLRTARIGAYGWSVCFADGLRIPTG